MVCKIIGIKYVVNLTYSLINFDDCDGGKTGAEFQVYVVCRFPPSTGTMMS